MQTNSESITRKKAPYPLIIKISVEAETTFKFYCPSEKLQLQRLTKYEFIVLKVPQHCQIMKQNSKRTSFCSLAVLFN